MVCLQALLRFQVNDVFHSWFPFKPKLQSSPKELEIPCVLAVGFFLDQEHTSMYIYISVYYNS